MSTYTHVSVERSYQDKVATITIRRPEVPNAFNTQMIQDLHAAFTDLVQDTRLHAVILTGDGPSFSAGADISTMRQSATFSQEQNLSDALRHFGHCAVGDGEEQQAFARQPKTGAGWHEARVQRPSQAAAEVASARDG